MTKQNWGRFTARGGQDVETLINSMMSQISELLHSELSEKLYEALVLLGGYGRGEGGVVEIDGVESPHNNFDLLLVTRKLGQAESTALKVRIMKGLEKLSAIFKVGIDLSVINASKLRNASPRLIWYDMRFGHKTISGNSDFVPSLNRFTLKRIPSWDARNLMVNRGSLMIINDLLISSGKIGCEQRRLIIKHLVKAIIGYGDTLLYFLNDYDWSYLEKQKRMMKRLDIDPDFKDIYNEAMEFRFKPDYSKYDSIDLIAWSSQLRSHFETIFLYCEKVRMNLTDISWDSYFESALRFALFDEIFSLKPLIKKTLNILKNNGKVPKGFDLIPSLGFSSLSLGGILPLLYPLIAFKSAASSYQELTVKLLNAKSNHRNDLAKAYLRNWGLEGDINFANVLKKQNISLED